MAPEPTKTASKRKHLQNYKRCTERDQASHYMLEVTIYKQIVDQAIMRVHWSQAGLRQPPGMYLPQQVEGLYNPQEPIPVWLV